MKKIICVIVTLVIMLVPLSQTVIAAEAEQEMVYVSNADRERVYAVTQKESFKRYSAFKEWGVEIVKDSITPVYEIDPLEYARTGKYSIVRFSHKSSNEDVYIAKTVTAQGEYAGNIMFDAGSNASICNFIPTNAIEEFRDKTIIQSSCSYADHAARIRDSFKLNSFVSPTNVKYVSINGVGRFFCVNIEGTDYFINAGSVNINSSNKTDLILTAEDLKELADKELKEYNEQLAEKEKWEKEHPGEVYTVDGGETSLQIEGGFSRIDNIMNIAEYLNIDMQAVPYVENPIVEQGDDLKEDTLPKTTVAIIVSVSAVGVLALGFVCFKVLKNKKQK